MEGARSSVKTRKSSRGVCRSENQRKLEDRRIVMRNSVWGGGGYAREGGGGGVVAGGWRWGVRAWGMHITPRASNRHHFTYVRKGSLVPLV